jgi:hypothetical protein
MNWKLKAFFQKFISVVPFGQKLYDSGKAFSLRSSEASRNHFEDVKGLVTLIRQYVLKPESDIAICEIGTGWVPTVSLMLRLGNYKRIVSFDIEPHLRAEGLKIASEQILAQRDELSELYKISSKTIDAFLSQLVFSNASTSLQTIGIDYVTASSFSTCGIEDGSLDVIFSRAVLEHIPKVDLEKTIPRCYRLLRPQWNYGSSD